VFSVLSGAAVGSRSLVAAPRRSSSEDLSIAAEAKP
jgi:hypothetical protein